MEYRDYYQTLGVAKSATEKEIRSAFRRLAQRYHPDKNPGDQQAEDKFKEINEAYEVLGDSQKRAKYDQLGASYSRWQQAGYPGGNFDFAQWAGTGGAAAGQGLNDLFGEGGFSDFFNSLFGGRGPGHGRRTRVRSAPAWSSLRGEDMEQSVEISLEEAYTGARRTLQKGDRRLEVNIPAGARTGTKIRIAGAGGAGQAAGDLYLLVTVQPHPRFRREGDDLHVDLPVSLYTALLGGEARVPTPAGEVVLNVPGETQSGRKFRLAGRGLPKLRQPEAHGDLYVHVMVQVPTDLTEHERRLFEELRALRAQRPMPTGEPAPD